MTYLTKEQREVLLRPLQSERVAQRKQANRSLSYLEAWDVRAHLIRIFDFGGYSTEVTSCQLLACEKEEGAKNWVTAYQVTMRLTVPQLNATFEDGAVGFAQLPAKGEALDMALKTAMSDALKRCAINLGTQFGLSLYDNGRTQDVVRTVLSQPGVAVTHSESGTYPEGGDEPERSVTEQGESGPGDGDVEPEPEQPEGPSEMAGSVMVQLREHALVPDHAKRVLAVAEIKEGASEELLAEVVTLASGDSVTLARLADMVSSGAFLNGGQ